MDTLCELNVMEQVYVNKINDILGNINATVDFSAVSSQRQGDERDMIRLIEEMNAGQVAVAIVWGANPAYELPNAAKFKEAFAKVGARISFSGIMDETTALARRRRNSAARRKSASLGRRRGESSSPSDPT